MIFAVKGHVQQVINGEKTQTRRISNRYNVGQTYAVQPKRTAKGIPEGRILITAKRLELYHFMTHVSEEDAKAEGGYIPVEFETLYEKMHPNWEERWAYTFQFVPAKDSRSKQK